MSVFVVPGLTQSTAVFPEVALLTRDAIPIVESRLIVVNTLLRPFGVHFQISRHCQTCYQCSGHCIGAPYDWQQINRKMNNWFEINRKLQKTNKSLKAKHKNEKKFLINIFFAVKKMRRKKKKYFYNWKNECNECLKLRNLCYKCYEDFLGDKEEEEKAKLNAWMKARNLYHKIRLWSDHQL